MIHLNIMSVPHLVHPSLCYTIYITHNAISLVLGPYKVYDLDELKPFKP